MNFTKKCQTIKVRMHFHKNKQSKLQLTPQCVHIHVLPTHHSAMRYRVATNHSAMHLRRPSWVTGDVGRMVSENILHCDL